MTRALLILGLLLIFLALVPDWGHEDYFEIKRVSGFEMGFLDPLFQVREWLVPDRNTGEWKLLARTVSVEPLSLSGAFLVLGVVALGLRRYFQRSTSNTVPPGSASS